MENNIFAMSSTEGRCSRCNDEKTVNRYGVCDHCDTEIDDEYMEIYNLQNMEN